MIRKRLQFYGRVQGVGFRHTAIRAANGLRITGWVRNERDGSVTVEAQGSDEAISRMMEIINSGSHIYIERILTTKLSVVDEEKGFSVKWT